MSEHAAQRRWPQGLNLTVFLAGVVVIAVVANVLAAHPALRLRVDATQTRAYSLSEQTRRLLADLEGDWTIALVMGEQTVDRAIAKQAEEVLDRFREASPYIEVVRIDPAAPASLDRYERLLSRLRTIHAEEIEDYEAALERARGALEDFDLFLKQRAGRLVTMRRAAGAADAGDRVDQLLATAALRAEQVRQVRQETEKAMRVDEGRPLPDYETARSILAAALGGWADELYEIAVLLGRWRDDATLPQPLRRFAGEQRPAFEAEAQRLAAAADPLKHLAALHLGRIGRALEQGETAVVLGPGGTAVVPPGQLLPRLNLRSRESGEVAFDQRFRGEQAIAAAIRSLRTELPVVVLVHAEERSLLSRHPQNVDFVGAAEILDAARIETTEWNVTAGERPVPAAGRRAVWVVVPPPVPARRTLAVSEAEQALIEAGRTLLADGEPLLLNFTPSGQSRTGRRDPWRALAGPLGLSVETDHVIYERVTGRDGEAVNQRVHATTGFVAGHPIAEAVHGLRASFDLPVPVRLDEAPPGVRRAPLAVVEPAPDRWLETQWMVNPQRIDEPTADDALGETAPIVVAVQRRHPVEPGEQRIVVVGSGGWLLSYLADVVVGVEGVRGALVNPGNYELLLASIAWLAEADELIARSPVSRQVARLSGVTRGARAAWRFVALALIPVGCLAAGVGAWALRRSGA